GQVAADQQVVPRGGGAQPHPPIPALALRAGPRGADLPAVSIVEQAGDRLGAGERDPPRPGEAGARGNPQHIPLAVFFSERAQLGAVAVDLIAAQEIDPGAVGTRLGANIDGQLALGAEPKVRRQAREQRLHRVTEVPGRDPLPGADQRMPGLLAHIRQVHRGNAIGHLAHAPQVLALDTGRGSALLDLAGLIDRADPQALPPASTAGRPIQPRHRGTAPPPSPRRWLPPPGVGAPAGPAGAPGPPPAGRPPPLCPWQGRCPAPRHPSPPAATAPPAQSTAAAVPAAHRASGPPPRPLSW